MGHYPASFSFTFGLFKYQYNTIQNFHPVSGDRIQTQPSEYESPPFTTRPGLPLKSFIENVHLVYFCLKKWVLADLFYFRSYQTSVQFL